jgi:Acetyltransferase (GNAT) domain
VVELSDGPAFREETLEEASDYADLVSRSTLATPFHRPEWLSVVQAVTGDRLSFLRVLQGQETVAVLPHIHGRWGPLRVLLSPPSRVGMQYLGPLVPGWPDLKQDKREARLAALAVALRAHMKEDRVRLCQIRCPPGLDDARAFQWMGFDSVPRYTYRLRIDDQDSVWEGMKKSVRSDIRRREDNIAIGPGDGGDWGQFENQLHARYSEQGLHMPLADEYLTKLRDALGPDLTLLVARAAGSFLGGAALVRTGGSMALWQGTVRGPPGIPLNDLLIWHSIQYARSLGCSSFELMGANTPQLAEFKSKFNPTLESYLEVRRLPLWADVARKTVLRIRRGAPFS